MAGELFAYTNLICIAMRSTFSTENLLSEPYELLLHSAPGWLKIISDIIGSLLRNW